MIQQEQNKEQFFEKVYSENKDKIYSLILSKVRNPQDVEEISQEVWRKVWHNLHQFKGNSQISTWVQKIARNLITDVYKSRSRKKETLFSDFSLEENETGFSKGSDITNFLDSLHHQSHGYEEAEEKNNKVELVRRAISKLSDKHRSLLEKKVYQNMTLQSIANQESLPLGTVMSRVYYAKRQLKIQLLKEGVKNVK